MKLLWQIIAVIIFVIGCVFALLNAQVVTLHLLLGQVSWPLAFYLLIALVLGCFIGLIVGRSYRKRK